MPRRPPFFLRLLASARAEGALSALIEVQQWIHERPIHEVEELIAREIVVREMERDAWGGIGKKTEG